MVAGALFTTCQRRALLAFALLGLPLTGCLGETPEATGTDATPPSPRMNDSNASANGTDAAEPASFPVVERTIVAEDVLPHDPPQNYSYDPARVDVPVNATVELTLVSHPMNLLDHDVRIGDRGVQSRAIPPGESLTLTFNVTKPGPSVFWCTIGDHRERGMEGALVVGDEGVTR